MANVRVIAGMAAGLFLATGSGPKEPENVTVDVSACSPSHQKIEASAAFLPRGTRADSIDADNAKWNIAVIWRENVEDAGADPSPENITTNFAYQVSDESRAITGGIRLIPVRVETKITDDMSCRL